MDHVVAFDGQGEGNLGAAGYFIGAAHGYCGGAVYEGGYNTVNGFELNGNFGCFGNVVELVDIDDYIGGLCEVLGYLECYIQECAVLCHRAGGHNNAETDGTGDGLIIGNYDGILMSVKNIALCETDDLENGCVVIKLCIEGGSLILALDREGKGYLAAGKNILSTLHCEYGMGSGFLGGLNGFFGGLSGLLGGLSRLFGGLSGLFGGLGRLFGGLGGLFGRLSGSLGGLNGGLGSGLRSRINMEADHTIGIYGEGNGCMTLTDGRIEEVAYLKSNRLILCAALLNLQGYIVENALNGEGIGKTQDGYTEEIGVCGQLFIGEVGIKLRVLLKAYIFHIFGVEEKLDLNGMSFIMTAYGNGDYNLVAGVNVTHRTYCEYYALLRCARGDRNKGENHCYSNDKCEEFLHLGNTPS